MDELAINNAAGIDHQPGDDLRLIGLHRIPLCSDCSRLNCLIRAHLEEASQLLSLPPAPPACTSLFCASLTARYAQDD